MAESKNDATQAAAGEAPELPTTAPETAVTAEDGGDENTEGELRIPCDRELNEAPCSGPNSF